MKKFRISAVILVAFFYVFIYLFTATNYFPVPLGGIAFILFSFLFGFLVLKKIFIFNKIDYALILIMLCISSLSFLLSGYYRSLLYSIPLIGLLGLSRFNINSPHFNINFKYYKFSAYLLMTILFSLVLLSIPFFMPTHGERESILWITDPNYSALMLMVPLVIMWTFVSEFSKSKIISGFFYLILLTLFIFIFIKTQSRGYFLSLVVFLILFYFRSIIPIIRLRIIAYLAIFLPFIAQILISYYFLDSFGVKTEDVSRLAHFNDDSNFARMQAFLSALEFSQTLIFTGTTLNNFMVMSDAPNIPHNWILMMVITSGWLYFIIFIVMLLRVVNNAHGHLIPILIALLLFGSVLGDVIFVTVSYLLITMFYFYVIISNSHQSDLRKRGFLVKRHCEKVDEM